MLRISFSLPIDESAEAEKNGFFKIVQGLLGVTERDILSLSLFKKSLDARKGRPFVYLWTVDVTLTDRTKEQKTLEKCQKTLKNIDYKYIEKEELYSFPSGAPRSECRPVVAGFGPAGIFCALMLARAGANPIVLERGGTVDERVKAVNSFFSKKTLDENCNIQFGEGGAGTFSDGKLNTLVKDKNFRGYFILKEFVKAGAPEDILYTNKPHIGTDLLRQVVKNMRNEIVSCGGEVLFNSKLTDIIIKDNAVTAVLYERDGKQTEFETDSVFLATGHSARDIFALLQNKKVPMERKPFSVGVRIEHLQSEIDKTQYRSYAGSPFLPPSDYKLVYHTGNGRALYTFCMCPGGTVIAAASESGGIVTNGMSYHARDGKNANSALLVTVQPDDLTEEGIFAGVNLQKRIEKKAFELGGSDYSAPCQRVEDFFGKRATVSFGAVKPSYLCGVKGSDLNGLFPEFVTETLQEGIKGLDTMLKGFDCPDAVLTAPESRSTSPIRILRGEDMQSSIKGLFPVGEGAGFAGGIMSAAIDGLKAAESYFK